jgi:hypothetical protein
MQLYRIILLLFISFLTASSLLAQVDDPIKIDSSIVRLNVGVVDQRGRPITSLNRSNFSVYEDGVKQDVSRFETAYCPLQRRNAARHERIDQELSPEYKAFRCSIS